MDDTKHTPGAMRAAEAIGASIQSCVNANHPAFWTDATYRDLATVIDRETAAPDMLALLEEIVEPTGRDVVDTLKEIRTKARALIAKATGQP